MSEYFNDVKAAEVQSNLVPNIKQKFKCQY